MPIVEKETRKYICKWCRHEFNQDIGTGGSDERKVTDQVRCPVCMNFLRS